MIKMGLIFAKNHKLALKLYWISVWKITRFWQKIFGPLVRLAERKLFFPPLSRQTIYLGTDPNQSNGTFFWAPFWGNFINLGRKDIYVLEDISSNFKSLKQKFLLVNSVLCRFLRIYERYFSEKRAAMLKFDLFHPKYTLKSYSSLYCSFEGSYHGKFIQFL